MFAGKKSAQIREILISESAWEEMTCLFAPSLKQNTYCSFDLMTGTASANSRHSVGHGAAAAKTYTKEKAIQAILTFDQIVFYL